jgi:hypothetical protein
MNDELDQVDGVYIVQMLLSDAAAAQAPVGMADLARFLTVPGAQLTAEQSRKLFADKALRQGYARLKAALVSYEVPALIAASDGEVDERPFEGGALLLVRDGASGWYLRVRIDEGPRPENPFLLIEPDNGAPLKIALGKTDATGAYLVLLNDADTHDRTAIAALRDPLSRAFILATTNGTSA